MAVWGMYDPLIINNRPSTYAILWNTFDLYRNITWIYSEFGRQQDFL